MPTKTKASPTQKLRNLIEGVRFGLVDADDLHNELLELEREQKLPLTEPEED
ncbi:hypothetical protein NNX28_16815 [Arthrobacter sp. zg-Y859]|uniref:Uncharacterized protein n=1 Tax=Arthrobacter jinronghuae TaxID=2964609 RepID=A0ABT1NYA3_9MICC|nr:hypothetical protein [Arthrobacter jinronghuae]MCQ1951581.1 hypothetical protein [Arthrobacter jinronghuae]UWX79704.1 hypothetical protein N2K98_05765 [Arthrobacter jinronghuae]